jgi:hypothetical protein
MIKCHSGRSGGSAPPGSPDAPSSSTAPPTVGAPVAGLRLAEDPVHLGAADRAGALRHAAAVGLGDLALELALLLALDAVRVTLVRLGPRGLPWVSGLAGGPWCRSRPVRDATTGSRPRVWGRRALRRAIARGSPYVSEGGSCAPARERGARTIPRSLCVVRTGGSLGLRSGADRRHRSVAGSSRRVERCRCTACPTPGCTATSRVREITHDVRPRLPSAGPR